MQCRLRVPFTVFPTRSGLFWLISDSDTWNIVLLKWTWSFVSWLLSVASFVFENANSSVEFFITHRWPFTALLAELFMTCTIWRPFYMPRSIEMALNCESIMFFSIRNVTKRGYWFVLTGTYIWKLNFMRNFQHLVCVKCVCVYVIDMSLIWIGEQHGRHAWDNH